MSTRTAIIIPARWGSTRFPGKPLHRIAGRPLIEHVWSRCRLVPRVECVIIATDDERIATAARAFGAEVEMTSSTHQSGTDRCAEVAALRPELTHVLNVQGDEPLTDPALVTQLVNVLRAEAGPAMVTAACPIPEAEAANPSVVKVVLASSGDALYFSRAPIPYARDATATQRYRHLGIYGYSVPFLREFVRWPLGKLEQIEQLEQLRALENGAAIRVVITDHSAPGVDTPEDAQRVEELLAATAGLPPADAPGSPPLR